MTGQLESLIPEPEQQGQDTEIQDAAEEITGTLQAAFDILIERRNSKYAAAIAELDAEIETLGQERAAIGEAAQNLAELLPARVRVAQAEHDRLLLAGDREGAAVKLAEQKEAEAAPGAMSARKSEISARIEAIEAEKREIAKGVFASWHAELQSIIRATEHGLFLDLLDSARAAMYAYQERHGLGSTLADPYGFLVKDSHLQNLTAPERSAEWASGHRWYGGRGR